MTPPKPAALGINPIAPLAVELEFRAIVSKALNVMIKHRDNNLMHEEF